MVSLQSQCVRQRFFQSGTVSLAAFLGTGSLGQPSMAHRVLELPPSSDNQLRLSMYEPRISLMVNDPQKDPGQALFADSSDAWERFKFSG